MTTVDGDEPIANESTPTAQLRAVAGLGRLTWAATLDSVMIEAVRLVSTTLETAFCGVFECHPDGTELRLGWGVGWQPETVGRRTISAATTTQAGYTLQSASPVVVADSAADTRFDRSRLLAAHDVTSGISVVIGPVDAPWGVLGTYSTAPRPFSESDVDFVEAVGNTLTAAVDRHAHGQERARQRAELAFAERIAILSQSITSRLIDSTSVPELEQLVCDRLVDARYPTAVIAHLRPKQGMAKLRAIAGITDGYRDAVKTIPPETFRTAIGGRVRETGETQIVDDVRGDSRVPESLQAWARDHDARSLIAVPICYRSICYGMILVWSTSVEGFGSRERRLLTELGETIGLVTHGINSQQFVDADRVVELTFEVGERSTPFETELDDCTVSVDGVIQQADNSVFCYLSLTDGDPDRLVGAAASDPRIRSARRLTTTPDHTLLEIVFGDDTIFATVIMVGGQLSHATRADGRSRLRAVFQPTVDVRWVVETVQKYHPEWELAAKAYRDKPDQTDGDRRLQTARSRLTERQAAVLETAYLGGYFEWPRHSTAEEIAASLDIAPPTFHKHIRTSLQKLVGSLCDRLSTE